MVKDATGTRCRVHFEPGNIDIAVDYGSSLLEAAIQAGIRLVAACGGSGTCGTCKVVIREGIVNTAHTGKISEEEYKSGFRQACQSKVTTDLYVYVPPESVLPTVDPTGNLSPAVARISSGKTTEGMKRIFSPPLKKYYLSLPPPTLSDNLNDLSRLLRGLKQEYGIIDATIEFDVLKVLPVILRDGNWHVTVTTFRDHIELSGAARKKPLRIINIEPGDTRDRHYALAIDLGTTTVKGQLLDLNHRQIVTEASEYNKQISYGADIITRIACCGKDKGLETLQQAAVESINNVIHRLVAAAGISRDFIGHIILAGNTTMVHILMGLETRFIRLAPYTPVASYLPPVRAKSLGIDAGHNVYLSVFPAVASYIGGDIVAGVIATGMHRSQKISCYIDVGTNGQIVIGNKDWMMTAACSAGPAFEGGGIKHGVIATEGAIDECEIDPNDLTPDIKTIGGGKPKGICGSGLINIVAALLKSGIIGQNGHFITKLSSNRIRRGSDGYEYVLVPGEDTETGSDIVITEIDIDNLIKAKAAIYAGFKTLLKEVGHQPEDIERIFVAGAFGNRINIDKAIVVGLLPDLPRKRFEFVGNGSLAGARLAEFSEKIASNVRRVAGLMTNFELSENARFMNNYIAALFLPHTDIEEFPTVGEYLVM